ncbi:MAG: hypothetical protein P8184_04715 [Calditrichia bacterium]
MKIYCLVVVLFLSAGVCLAFSAKLNTELPSGEKYKNDTKENIYLVVVLEPGQEIANNTGYEMQLMTGKKFSKFDYELESQIEELQRQIRLNESEIIKLNREIGKTNPQDSAP